MNLSIFDDDQTMGARNRIGTAVITAIFNGQYTKASIYALVRGMLKDGQWTDIDKITVVNTNPTAYMATVAITMPTYESLDTGTIEQLFRDLVRDRGGWGAVVGAVNVTVTPVGRQSSPAAPSVKGIGNNSPLAAKENRGDSIADWLRANQTPVIIGAGLVLVLILKNR